MREVPGELGAAPQAAPSCPGRGAGWSSSDVRVSGAAIHPELFPETCCSHGQTSGCVLTAPSRFSLQDAGIGFILVIDRRQDRWTSVKASILRIAVSVGVVAGPATSTPSPGRGHGLSCPVALWVLAGAAYTVGPKAEVDSSWGLGRASAHLPGLLELLGHVCVCMCTRVHAHVCAHFAYVYKCVRVCACMYFCAPVVCNYSRGLALRGCVIP